MNAVLANRKLVVLVVVVIIFIIMMITTIGSGGEAPKTPTVASNPAGSATAARAATVVAGDTASVPPPPTGSPVRPPTQTLAPVVVRVGFPTDTVTPTATPTAKASPVGRGTVVTPTKTVTQTVAALVIADFPPIPTDDNQSLIAITGTYGGMDWEGIGFVWGRTCLKGCIARAEAREFPTGIRVLVPNMNLEISGTLKYEQVAFSDTAAINRKLDQNWVKLTDLTAEPRGAVVTSIPTSAVVITTLGKQTVTLGGQSYRMLVVTDVLVEKIGEVVRLTLKDAWWILLPDGEAKDKILDKINQIPPPLDLTPTPTPTRVGPTATRTKVPPTPTRTATPTR